MPKILDAAVQQMMKRGVAKDKAYAMAVSSLQKAGDLRSGSLKATQKGAKRGAMSHAQRAATRKS